MNNITQNILDLIRIDFFATFAIFSFMIFTLKLFKWKDESITEIDKRIVNSVPKIGVIWFILFISQDLILNITKSQTNYILEYRSSIILQYTIWFFLTQLFRIPSIKKSYLLRILLSLLFLIDIESIDILAIILAKNEIPNTWINYETNTTLFGINSFYFLLFFNTFIKLVLYCIINYLFKFFDSKKYTEN